MNQAINELLHIRDILKNNYEAANSSPEQQQLRLEKIESIDTALQVLNKF